MFQNELFIEKISMKKNPSEYSYINELPVVFHLQNNPIEFHKQISIFVGENGVVKSTLVEAIAVAIGLNAEGGSRNFMFETRGTHSKLYKCLSVTKGPYRPKDSYFLRAESFYNVATNIDDMDSIEANAPPIIWSYGGVSLHNQSHGESFMSLVENRFRPGGLYILDEPEAALSPQRVLTLMCHIKRLTDEGAQFIISTHSPMLLSFPDADVFEISERGICKIPYKETEHYRVTKTFLDDPERMHRMLFDE